MEGRRDVMRFGVFTLEKARERSAQIRSIAGFPAPYHKPPRLDELTPRVSRDGDMRCQSASCSRSGRLAKRYQPVLGKA